MNGKIGKLPGFTLIELLIVVSIIAILSLIGLLLYSEVNKAGRDAKRRSDLRLIQTALEQYHADKRFYPGSDSLVADSSLTDATGISPAPPVNKTYLNSIPKGPNGTGEYLYKAYKKVGGSDVICVTTEATLCYKYCLFAQLETATEQLSSCPDQGATYKLEFTSP